MTDFVSELEAELLAAARRRATRRRRHPRGRRPRILVAATALAAVLVAVAFVPRPAPDDRPVVTGGVPGGFAVPPIGIAEICDPPVRLTGEPPKRAEAALAVLTRLPRPGDDLPLSLQDSQSTWLPAGDWSGMSRRPAAMAKRVLVLGTNNVRSRPLACGGDESRGDGACLVVPAKTREALRARCFTLEEIRAGRAFALMDASGTGARLIGIVPDDIAEIELTVGQATVRVRAVENAVQRYVRGLRPGDQIGVKLNEHQPTVMIAGERASAEEAAATLERTLHVKTEVSAAKGSSGDVIEVMPLRPGLQKLADEVGRLLGATRVGREPPKRKMTQVTANTPDVVVWLRMR